MQSLINLLEENAVSADAFASLRQVSAEDGAGFDDRLMLALLTSVVAVYPSGQNDSVHGSVWSLLNREDSALARCLIQIIASMVSSLNSADDLLRLADVLEKLGASVVLSNEEWRSLLDALANSANKLDANATVGVFSALDYMRLEVDALSQAALPNALLQAVLRNLASFDGQQAFSLISSMSTLGFTRGILAAQAGVIDGLLQLLMRIVDERLPCVLPTVTSLYDLGVKWQEINAIPELAAMVINQSAAELVSCDPADVCDAALALAKWEGMHDDVLVHHASFKSSLLSAVGRVLDDVDNTQFDALLKSLVAVQAEWPEIQLAGLADGLLQRIHDYVFQLSQSPANIAELIQCVDTLSMPLDNTVGKALRTVVAIHQPVESILRPDSFSQALLALCAATDAEIQLQHCFLGIIPVTFVVAKKLIITMSTQTQSTVWEVKRDGLIAAKGYAVETLRDGMDFSTQINQFLIKHRLPLRLQSRLTVSTVSQLSLFPPERQKRAREEQEPTAGPEEKRVRVASSDDQAGTDAENAAVLTLKRN